MRILVFQHIACEHPGIFRKYLAEDGINWTPVELDAGEPIPALEDFDTLWVMGGPMDVWDIEDNPWLVAEKRAIRRWVRELDRPFLGLCLGHQLLADALGGTCGPQRPSEIGILPVNLTEAANSDPVFAGLPDPHYALQWHSVRVAQAPGDAIILAKSDICSNQAMRVGSKAWSMQYHMEIEPDTISNWGEIPAYRDALVAARGEGALEQMATQAAPRMADIEACSRQVYRNFMKAIS